MRSGLHFVKRRDAHYRTGAIADHPDRQSLAMAKRLPPRGGPTPTAKRMRPGEALPIRGERFELGEIVNQGHVHHAAER